MNVQNVVSAHLKKLEWRPVRLALFLLVHGYGFSLKEIGIELGRVPSSMTYYADGASDPPQEVVNDLIHLLEGAADAAVKFLDKTDADQAADYINELIKLTDHLITSLGEHHD